MFKIKKKADFEVTSIKTSIVTEEEMLAEIETLKKPAIKCPICYKDTDLLPFNEDCFCMDCDVIIHTEEKCPDCGAYTYEHNDPGKDTTMGIYCYKSHKTIENQYMHREDFIELEGPNYLICDER